MLFRSYHNIVKVDSNANEGGLRGSGRDTNLENGRSAGASNENKSNLDSKSDNSPSLAEDNSSLSPSLAEGARGWVKNVEKKQNLDSKDSKESNENTESKCDIVGAICESGDYMAKDRDMPLCNSGDLLLIESAGAYGYSMSSNYNSRMRAAQVALYKDTDYLLQEREDFNMSVANEDRKSVV